VLHTCPEEDSHERDQSRFSGAGSSSGNARSAEPAVEVDEHGDCTDGSFAGGDWSGTFGYGRYARDASEDRGGPGISVEGRGRASSRAIELVPKREGSEGGWEGVQHATREGDAWTGGVAVF